MPSAQPDIPQSLPPRLTGSRLLCSVSRPGVVAGPTPAETGQSWPDGDWSCPGCYRGGQIFASCESLMDGADEQAARGMRTLLDGKTAADNTISQGGGLPTRFVVRQESIL